MATAPLHSLADFMNEPYEITEGDLAAQSPLWLITKEPALNELVLYLQDARSRIHEGPGGDFRLEFSKRHLAEVRDAFSRVIREGERHLHLLCRLLITELSGDFQMQSVVVGDIARKNERFTIVQPLTDDELFSVTDLDLGSSELREIKMYDGQEWVTPSLVANVVDYQPLELNEFGVHRITSRIKAEEEIWNKVVDEIFNLDTIVSRDKDLRRYSRYVKDIFGLKLVVGRMDDVHRLQARLSSASFSEAALKALEKYGLTASAPVQKLHFVEVKNYLSQAYQKKTGWEALKSVVLWADKTFELQIQPLTNFLLERERLTRESHAGFKATRETVRDQVAERIPLFRFYRDLLKWLFLDPTTEPPHFPGVAVVLQP